MSCNALNQGMISKLSRVRVIPVLSFSSAEEGLRLGEILCRCGLPAAEVTFRTTSAEAAIRAMRKEFPSLCLGAGPVLSVEQLERAIDAGAEFGVAPGLNPEIVKAAQALGFAFASGICTPSEIEAAYALGCVMMKFFPAEASGGIPMVKAISAPYKHLGVKFMPTGGGKPTNVAEYLAVPEIICCGGTWIVPKDALAVGDYAAIERLAAEAVALARSRRLPSALSC